MSIPLRRTDPRRVCLISLPSLNLGSNKREVLVYLSGALFAIGWWAFLDAAIISAHLKLEDEIIPVYISFADWVNGLNSTLGMIIVNLIDKQKLTDDSSFGDSGSWSSGSVAWRARLFLFLGFALMAGGLAGSVTVLVVKYVMPDYPDSFGISYGVAGVIQSILIMFSAIVLWNAQNSDDYEYSLTL